MPFVNDDPYATWVRFKVPANVADTVRRISRAMRVTMPYAYSVILTRELWGVDPLEYAQKLQSDLQGGSDES